MPLNTWGFILKTAQAFEQVFKHGKKISGKNFTILYLPNTLRHVRIGIIIGKARMPRAVDRNWLKRIIRETFRMHALSARREQAGLDVIVLFSAKGSELFMNHLTKKQRVFAWRDDIIKLFDRLH